jgi:hypothetical protein
MSYCLEMANVKQEIMIYFAFFMLAIGMTVFTMGMLLLIGLFLGEASITPFGEFVFQIFFILGNGATLIMFSIFVLDRFKFKRE